jgi:hypothetical protein
LLKNQCQPGWTSHEGEPLCREQQTTAHPVFSLQGRILAQLARFKFNPGLKSGIKVRHSIPRWECCPMGTSKKWEKNSI